MTISGKEIAFFYSIWADAAIDDELQKIGAVTLADYITMQGTGKAYARLAEILSEAAVRAEGGEKITADEVMNLNAGDLTAVINGVTKAIAAGSKTSIKTKSKNVKGGAQQS